MNVCILDKAHSDLEHLYEWISGDRPLAAIGVIERIFESLDLLALFPFMGRPGSVTDTYEWIVPGVPFIIIYEVDDFAHELRVIAIFHARQERDYEIE